MNLSELKNKYQNKNILVFTNKNSFKLYQDYFENNFEANLTYFRDFQVNPKLTDVKNCFESINPKDFDLIIGIGGGSAMDFAKAISYYCHFDLKNYREYLVHLKSPQQFENKKDLILIPTTSGSGSEGNCFSVIYDEFEKYSLASKAIYPSHVILDWKFVEKLPKKITAYTAIDAITHALEAYWAKGATDESRKISLQALELLVPNIRNVVHSPTQFLREKIMEGAFLAGKAIDIAKTTAPHAFSYYLTTHYNIPHGQAVAINLHYFIELNGRYSDLSAVHKIFGVATDAELKAEWVQLLKDIELYLNPIEVVENKNDFFKAVNTERLGNNPYPLKSSEFESIFSTDK